MASLYVWFLSTTNRTPNKVTHTAHEVGGGAFKRIETGLPPQPSAFLGAELGFHGGA